MNYEEHVKNNAGKILEKLVADLKKSKTIDIRFEFEENDQWSVVTTHMEEDDTEISLRLHADDAYELFLGYYDKQDEFQELVQPLSPEQKAIVPQNLQKLMQKVLDDEEGLSVSGKLLIK